MKIWLILNGSYQYSDLLKATEHLKRRRPAPSGRFCFVATERRPRRSIPRRRPTRRSLASVNQNIGVRRKSGSTCCRRHERLKGGSRLSPGGGLGLVKPGPFERLPYAGQARSALNCSIAQNFSLEQRGVGFEAEQDPAGRMHDARMNADMLRHRMDVAERALERAAFL